MNAGVPIEIPRVNANEDAVELLRRHVQDGDKVETGRLVADLGTSKASIAVESPAAGTLIFLHDEGDTIAVGAILGYVCGSDAEVAVARSMRSAAPIETHTGTTDGTGTAPSPARVSKAARRFLHQQGLDPASVAIGGLVSSRRAKRHATAGTRVELDWIKRAEVQALSRASTVLASSVSMPAPLSTRLRAAAALPFIVCQTARLLGRYPLFCAYFDDDAIVQYEHIHVGVAMDLGRGLRVVTVRDGVRQAEADVERALYDFTLRYLDDTLRPEDMSDATFTITDLSSFGVSGFQPRIGDRQAAILGIGAGASPGALTLTLVFDHRVANGRLAAMFLADLRDALREGEILDAAMAAEVQPLQQVSQQACDGASCDRCGIGLTAYYERYPQDAVMAVTLRPDGTHGLLCHICASGAI